MNRSGHDQAIFFHGHEVEHTPAYGKSTLFVIGVQSKEEISNWIVDFNSYKDQNKHIEHIFFGANDSFHPVSKLDWQRWESMIYYFLSQGYLCSLDIPYQYISEFNETGLNEKNNFIPIIKVAIPYIKLWNYNTCVKIDDIDFEATNPGVWVHQLDSLKKRSQFTDWSKYKGDEIIK